MHDAPPATIQKAPQPETRNFDLNKRLAPNPKYELPEEGKTSSVFFSPKSVDNIHKQRNHYELEQRLMGDMFLSRKPSQYIDFALRKLGLRSAPVKDSSLQTWIRDIVYTTNIDGKPTMFYYKNDSMSKLHHGKTFITDFSTEMKISPTFLRFTGGNMLETAFIHPDSTPNKEIIEKLTFVGRDIVISNLYNEELWKLAKDIDLSKTNLIPNNSEKYLAGVVVEDYLEALKKYLKIKKFYEKHTGIFKKLQESQNNQILTETGEIARSLVKNELESDQDELHRFSMNLLLDFKDDKNKKLYPFEATEFYQRAMYRRLSETGQTQPITNRNELENIISTRISFVVSIIERELQSRVQLIATPDTFRSRFGVLGHIDMSHYATINNQNQTILFFSDSKLVHNTLIRTAEIYAKAGDTDKAEFYNNIALSQQEQEAQSDNIRYSERKSHTALVLDMEYLGIRVVPAPISFATDNRYKFANVSPANSLSLPDLSNPEKPRMVTLAVGGDPVLNKLFEDFMKKYSVDVQFILGTNILDFGGSIHCATQLAIGPGDYRSVLNVNRAEMDKTTKSQKSNF